MKFDVHSSVGGTIISLGGRETNYHSILRITEHHQMLVTVYDITLDDVNQIREADYCCACIKLEEGDYFSLFDVRIREESYSVFSDQSPIKGTATLLARNAIRGSRRFSADDTFAKLYTGPLVKTTKRENIVNHGSLGYGIDFAAGGRA